MLHLSVFTLHNLMRWMTPIAAIWALYRAYRGWFGARSWTPGDQRAGRWFALALSLQLLIGGVFYCLPESIAQPAWTNLGAVIREPSLRFFVIEHSVPMFVALVLAHMGSALARRGATMPTAHRRAALFFSVSLLIAFATIPWPWTPHERPLARLGWEW